MRIVKYIQSRDNNPQYLSPRLNSYQDFAIFPTFILPPDSFDRSILEDISNISLHH